MTTDPPYVVLRSVAALPPAERDAVVRLMRQGRYVRLRHGILCRRDLLERAAGDPRKTHALHTASAMTALRHPTWASHESAALLHTLAVPGNTPRSFETLVRLTAKPGDARPRRTRALDLHVAELPVDEPVRILGVPITPVPRTVLDMARSRPLADALEIGDAALRDERLTRAQLEAALAACAGWPGCRRARGAVALMDGRHETALESRSVAMFVAQSVPLPEPQVRLGHSRVDFLWREQRVIGEADGRIKYVASWLSDSRTDAEETDRWWAEKRRQERLEAMGFVVVRWGWGDAEHRPRETAERIRDGFARAARLV